MQPVELVHRHEVDGFLDEFDRKEPGGAVQLEAPEPETGKILDDNGRHAPVDALYRLQGKDFWRQQLAERLDAMENTGRTAGRNDHCVGRHL